MSFSLFTHDYMFPKPSDNLHCWASLKPEGTRKERWVSASWSTIVNELANSGQPLPCSGERRCSSPMPYVSPDMGHTARLYYLIHPCHQLRQCSLEQHTPINRYSSEGPTAAPFKELWNPPSLPKFIRMEKHCLCWSLSPCLNQTFNITSNFRVASNYFTPWRELSYKEYHRLGLS